MELEDLGAKGDSNASSCLMKNCLNEHMITTFARFAKEQERRGDLVGELENTSSRDSFVRSPKADFS
jgi:hypothetical protein